MATTYYKYAERDATSQVNWAEIGKNMTDMLANETKIREQKKAEIDKNSREYAQVLADSPTGESETVRQMALKFANDASQYMLMQDKLLKSGQLRLSDYTIGRQSLMDDTDTAFTMMKDYQTVYGEKMQRYRDTESQEWELEAMDKVEGFGKFSQSGMFIDPTTGKVTVAMKELNPETGLYEMPKNPAMRASISTVKGLLQGKWDKFKPDVPIDATVDKMGEYIQTVRKIGKKNQAGEIMTVTDVLAGVRKNEDIQSEISGLEKSLSDKERKFDIVSDNGNKTTNTSIQLAKEIQEIQTKVKSLKSEMTENASFTKIVDFENNAIGAMLENPWNRLSLLTDSMDMAPDGKPYKFVYSEDEQKADPVHNIYMKPTKDNNNSLAPDFTKEQEEASTEWMRTQMRGRYDYKEQRQTVSDYTISPQQQQEWQRRYGDEKQQRETLINAWKDLRSGNLQQKKAALEYLNGSPYLKEQGLGNLKYTNNGNSITFDYVNPQTGAIINSVTKDLLVSGQALSGSDWLNSGSEAFGNLTEDERRKHSGGNYQFSEGQEGLASSRQFTPQAPAPADVDVSAQIKNSFSNIDAQIFDKEQDEVTQELQAAFSSYGIKVTPSGTLGDYVTIEIPGVATKEFPVDATTASGAIEYKANISNWLNENLNKENSKTLQGGGVGASYNPKPK